MGRDLQVQVAHEEYTMWVLYRFSPTLEGQCSLKALFPRYLHQRVPVNRAPFERGFYVDVAAFVVNYNDVYVEVLSLTYYFCNQK